MTDWTSRMPPFDSQFSAPIDVLDCVEESFCHIIFALTGFRASPRALGKMVGVDANGSGIYQCLYTALTHGLIPFDDWPTPDTFTWDSYYSDIPPQALLNAKFFDISVIDPDLAKSPLWTQLSFPGRNGQGSTLHWVAQINDTEYFDSEPGAIKPLTYGGAVVLSQHSLKINSMNLVNDNGTIWLEGPKGRIGLVDIRALSILKQLTDDIQTRPVANVPIVGLFEEGLTFHK